MMVCLERQRRRRHHVVSFRWFDAIGVVALVAGFSMIRMMMILVDSTMFWSLSADYQSIMMIRMVESYRQHIVTFGIGRGGRRSCGLPFVDHRRINESVTANRMNIKLENKQQQNSVILGMKCTFVSEDGDDVEEEGNDHNNKYRNLQLVEEKIWTRDDNVLSRPEFLQKASLWTAGSATALAVVSLVDVKGSSRNAHATTEFKRGVRGKESLMDVVATSRDDDDNGDNNIDNGFIPPDTTTALTIPLKFLPRAGCLAVGVTMNDAYKYWAVVDTGSPFLTAPDDAIDFTTHPVVITSSLRPLSWWWKRRQRVLFGRRNWNDADVNDDTNQEGAYDDTSNEQYGETIGKLLWRKSTISFDLIDTVDMTLNGSSIHNVGNERRFTIQTNLVPNRFFRQKDIVLGLTPTNLQEVSGGLFFGLIAQDDNTASTTAAKGAGGRQRHPTLLEQIFIDRQQQQTMTIYRSFVINYQDRTLQLHENSLLASQTHVVNSTTEPLPTAGISSASSTTTIVAKSQVPTKLVRRQHNAKSIRLPMYDLMPYGPNLHHYAVECSSVTFFKAPPPPTTIAAAATATATATAVVGPKSQQSVPSASISFSSNELRRCFRRPIVVVIDTGLTGCILSDSWKEVLSDNDIAQTIGASIFFEDSNDNRQIVKTTADIGKKVLRSNMIQDDDDRTKRSRARTNSLSTPSVFELASHGKYWYLSCFRLPWFTDESNHPHIIAAGSTFLVRGDDGRDSDQQTKDHDHPLILTIDNVSRMIQIEETQPL